MRDPKRIGEILNLIQQIWGRQPDTRFNQLIQNLQWEYDNKNRRKQSKTVYTKECHGEYIECYVKTTIVDLFNVEDEKFYEFLQDKAIELGIE